MNEAFARQRYRSTLALGGVIALAVGACVFGLWPEDHLVLSAPPAPVPPEAANAALAREHAYALSRGFTPAGPATDTATHTRPGTTPALTVPVTVGPRECVAFLIAGAGFVRPTMVELYGGGRYNGHVLVSHAPAGLVGHVQWCDVDGADVEARVKVTSHDPNDREPYQAGTLRYEVLRAPWDAVGGPAGITRGALDPTAVQTMASVGMDRALSMAPPASTGPVRVGPLPIVEGIAQLVPATAHAYQVLQTLASDGRPTGFPRVDTSRTPPGEAIPAGNDPAVVDVGVNQFMRALALLDTNAAPGCVTVEFRRGVAVYPPQIFRAPPVTAGLAGRTALATRENTAVDHWCPAQGAVVYLAADTDAAPYQLFVYDDPTNASPLPPAPPPSRATPSRR